MRRAPALTAAVAVVALTAGCAQAKGPQAEAPKATDSCIGSGCNLTYTPPSPAPAVGEPTTITIKLAVHSVSGDFGGYIVNLHNGTPAKQTTFYANGRVDEVPGAGYPDVHLGRDDVYRLLSQHGIAARRS